jgi:hypothetical protein
MHRRRPHSGIGLKKSVFGLQKALGLGIFLCTLGYAFA